MSSVIEELLTSTVGFIIAMVILGAIIGVGLYGYWLYTNHVTLENYLWPVAEVLPYQGEYFLGIVNTGHEPFVIEQIYLKGGGVLTPSQATNPNLNWCSVANTELMHNQWWCGETNQLPVAVRVCSALDPQVCSIAPVHGWQVATFNQAIGSGLMEVTVNDPLNAGWSVTWNYTGASYTLSNTTSYTWYVNPPYVPINITFTASITQNPSGYTCQIVPSSVTNTYKAGSTQAFNVTCTPLITVSVSDPYNAGWSITWSGAASGSQSGSSSTTFTVQPTSNGTVTFTASITSNPSEYQCSISPSSTTVNPGQTVQFTVSCQQVYYVYVTVTGSSTAGLLATWTISSSVSSITDTGYVSNVQLQIGGPTDTLTAYVFYDPSGYICNLSPSSETVTAGGSYTFTMSCQPVYGCYLTVQGQANPSGVATVSVSPTSTFVLSGSYIEIQASTSSEPWAVYASFQGWSANLTGPGSLSGPNVYYTPSAIYGYWDYTCPSGLTSDVDATVTITANWSP